MLIIWKWFWFVLLSIQEHSYSVGSAIVKFLMTIAKVNQQWWTAPVSMIMPVIKQISSLKKEVSQTLFLIKDVWEKAFVKITTKGRLVSVLRLRIRDMKLTAKECAAMKMSATWKILLLMRKTTKVPHLQSVSWSCCLVCYWHLSISTNSFVPIISITYFFRAVIFKYLSHAVSYDF